MAFRSARTNVSCRRRRPLLALAIALTALLGPTSSAIAAPQSPRHPQTLLLDAVLTQDRSTGPDASHVGHRHIVAGILRNSAGAQVGRLRYACTWTRILPNGDALDHCSGYGQTADGELDFAGQTRESSLIHTFVATGGTGHYRNARGTITNRQIGRSEALVAAALSPSPGSILTVATVPRPAANHTFLQRADRLCDRASTQLAALPPFPYPNFDPLHPDPSLLPTIGAFFTGPGDPRSTYRALITSLTVLGAPPAQASAWQRVLHARTSALRNILAQDTAALAANVPAFVDTARGSTRAFRRIAITATAFGATRCIL